MKNHFLWFHNLKYSETPVITVYGNHVMIAIVGPTASGKTALALQLAAEAGGEIINMDAYALYRGMDIGTAKPTLEQRQLVPHHLVDVLNIHEGATVADYQDQARAAVADIQKRGKPVFAVGGSGLYVRALCDKISFPGTDPLIRQRLETECAEIGSAALYRRLRELDPIAADNLHANNARRVIRALEVIEITGQPYSATLPSYENEIPTVFIGLRREYADIDELISERTEQMFSTGLVEEVQALLEKGLAQTRTARKATGYAEVMQYIAGEITLEQAVEAVALATRQLVRRQMKWFKRDPRINWIDATGKTANQIHAEALGILNAN